jgi:calcium-dependent protein kinase
MGACNVIEVKTLKKQNLKNSDLILPYNLVNHDKIQKKYKITEEFLGRGSSGIVSLAYDNKGNKYAIKTINKSQIKNIDFIIFECIISLKINHHNITKCYEVYEDSKTISFILEYIEGGDLLEYLLNLPENKSNEKECLDIIIQILGVIKYLHYDMNIVHRDLKLQNFLISFKNKKSIIKLSDFGFSCEIPKNGLMNEILGSPIYNAPEILLKQKYNCKCDVWSCGIILFNLLTGFQPFSTENEDNIDNEELYKDINFDVIKNNKFKFLCQNMLQKNPVLRWDSKKCFDFVKKIEKNFNFDSSDYSTCDSK